MDKALSVWVYRHMQDGKPLDCTNGGVSGREDMVLLVGDGVDGYLEVPSHVSTFDGRAILRLDRRGKDPRMIRAVPVVVGQKEPWFMDGGNFIYSCDSRFSALNNGFPIPIHDRVE